MKGKRENVLVVLAMAVFLAVMATACGGGSSTSTTGSSAPEQGTSEPAEANGLAAAEQLVEAAKKGEGSQVELPTKPVTPPKNVRVAMISVGEEAIAGPISQKAKFEALESIGWEPSQVFNGRSNPPNVARYIEQAIEEEYDAIFIDNTPISAISTALANARKAKIPVSCLNCVVPEDMQSKYLTSSVVDFHAAGRFLAAYAVSRIKGEGNILNFEENTFPQVQLQSEGFNEEVESTCPECGLEGMSLNVEEITKPGPPAFSAALSANPPGSIQAIQAPYDAFAEPMLKTSQQQGRDEYFISGMGGTPTFENLLKSESYPNLGVTGTEPRKLQAYFCVDQLARVLAGQPLDDAGANKVPSVLVDNTNVNELNEYGELPSLSEKYVNEFLALWGKK